jgi:hypothetical protein
MFLKINHLLNVLSTNLTAIHDNICYIRRITDPLKCKKEGKIHKWQKTVDSNVDSWEACYFAEWCNLSGRHVINIECSEMQLNYL